MSEIERKPTYATLAWFLSESATNLDQQAVFLRREISLKTERYVAMGSEPCQAALLLLKEISLKVEEVAALELAAENCRREYTSLIRQEFHLSVSLTRPPEWSEPVPAA
jgi:hypothetical protein